LSWAAPPPVLSIDIPVVLSATCPTSGSPVTAFCNSYLQSVPNPGLPLLAK